VKLEFEIELKNKYWCVTVFSLEEVFGEGQLFREPLNETQYVQMADWCERVFQTKKQPHRARRMSYDTFWFSSQRDFEWFILHWSSVDNDAF
jgi:hypothetical protein